MSTPLTMPPVITEDQVRRACAGSLEHTHVCARVTEQREVWRAFEKARDIEGARLRAAREARQVAAAKDRADAAEAARAADEAEIREGLRRQFFASNPSASAQVFARLADRLYDEHVLEQVRKGRDAATSALRRTGDYSL